MNGMFASALARASLAVLSCLQVGACSRPAAQPTTPNAVAREGDVTTPDGVQLHYELRGAGKASILVLHGGPGLSSAYLAPQLDDLAKAHTLIHYDQRGSGRSTLVTDVARLRLEDHVADIEAVRRHFGIERLVLLGHSWGAALAAFYAKNHPDHVAKVILLEPLPIRDEPYLGEFGTNLHAWMDEATRARVAELAAARKNASDPVAACRAYFGVFIRGYLADPRDASAPARLKGDACAMPAEALRNGPRVWQGALPGSWDWRESFHDVTAPVLVILGDRSPIPAQSGAEWQKAFPSAKLVSIAGAGHFPNAEQPAAFLQAVETFLK